MGGGLGVGGDGESKEPIARASKVTEAVVRRARDLGVLVYSGTGLADGTDGDSILLGPPFVITDDELVRIADIVADSIDAATKAAQP